MRFAPRLRSDIPATVNRLAVGPDQETVRADGNERCDWCEDIRLFHDPWDSIALEALFCFRKFESIRHRVGHYGIRPSEGSFVPAPDSSSVTPRSLSRARAITPPAISRLSFVPGLRLTKSESERNGPRCTDSRTIAIASSSICSSVSSRLPIQARGRRNTLDPPLFSWTQLAGDGVVPDVAGFGCGGLHSHRGSPWLRSRSPDRTEIHAATEVEFTLNMPSTRRSESRRDPSPPRGDPLPLNSVLMASVGGERASIRDDTGDSAGLRVLFEERLRQVLLGFSAERAFPCWHRSNGREKPIVPESAVRPSRMVGERASAAISHDREGFLRCDHRAGARNFPIAWLICGLSGTRECSADRNLSRRLLRLLEKEAVRGRVLEGAERDQWLARHRMSATRWSVLRRRDPSCSEKRPPCFPAQEGSG